MAITTRGIALAMPMDAPDLVLQHSCLGRSFSLATDQTLKASRDVVTRASRLAPRQPFVINCPLPHFELGTFGTPTHHPHLFSFVHFVWSFFAPHFARSQTAGMKHPRNKSEKRKGRQPICARVAMLSTSLRNHDAKRLRIMDQLAAKSTFSAMLHAC
jgi:hypothetical protein